MKKLPNHSSGNIRQLIEQGSLQDISWALGHPFSLYALLKDGHVSLSGLALLPEKDYSLLLIQNGQKFPASGHVFHNPPLLKINFTGSLPQEGFVEILFNQL